jgi:hypothetical protein
LERRTQLPSRSKSRGHSAPPTHVGPCEMHEWTARCMQYWGIAHTSSSPNSLRDWERAYIYVTFAYMQKPRVPNSTLDHTSTTDISSETFFCHGSVQHSYPGGFVLSSDMMFAPRRHVALSYSNDSCPMVSLVSPLSHTWLLGREQSMLTRRHRTVLKLEDWDLLHLEILRGVILDWLGWTTGLRFCILKKRCEAELNNS